MLRLSVIGGHHESVLLQQAAINRPAERSPVQSPLSRRIDEPRRHNHVIMPGPLRTWPETGAPIVAGRLAWRHGAPKLGRVMYELAWRAAPRHPRTCFYHATSIFHRRGWVLAALRNFTRAHKCIDRAQAMAPDDPDVRIKAASRK
ncbi:MAG: hypothetical protein KJZ87_12655 [Thermoguttaceae bacterium]|nr:hypothetical protein [Thermoguttaceae bacterium]